MKSLMHLWAGLVLLLPIAVNAASLGEYPAPSDPCKDEREASYASGYAAGESNGFQVGHQQGHQAGHDMGIRQCVAEPLQFGVTLASVIPAATYGETEPNDNFISADPLIQGANFWAQLYGPADQDWFYIETTAPNQNILVTFSVPYWINNVNLLDGRPAVWNISVRDAAGNIFANYNTNIMGAIDSYDKDRETFYSMTYSITAGLVGTYYIVVKPVDDRLICGQFCNVTAYPYSVAVVVQDSPLVNNQPIVGFYDVEVEPNDVPSQANRLATGVSMYGAINLTFNTGVVPDPSDPDNRMWAQGEDDWYVYNSRGNEIVSLEFCTKDQCARGNWFVEVYDQATATRVENGAPRQSPQVVPLLAFNTDNVNDPSATYRIGLRDPGYYFMRVSHKRLFTAPCVGYLTDIDNDGLPGPDPQSCACTGGESSCTKTILNPSDPVVDVDTETTRELEYPPCPGSGDRTAMCPVECVCAGSPEHGLAAPESGCATLGYNPMRCECPFGLYSCDLMISNPGSPTVNVETKTTETVEYELCPDGSGGGSNPQCEIGCVCAAFGGTVELPEGSVTSSYNFTWHGTQLPPSTIDTDAYEDYLGRSNPYAP